MNFHSDEWIMERVREHYNEALEHFPEDRIVGIILQGSQNYLLDTEHSDIDTKLIITPTFEDIAMNRQPISTTYVRADNSHTDWKDIRLMLKTFRSCNLNFLEILFSPYCIINPLYTEEWNRLIQDNELIANYDPCRAVKTMRGLAHRKHEQMEHDSPSHHDDIDKYGYSPKEFHHLLRIEEYIERYISGESYEDCLHTKKARYLKSLKLEPLHLDAARFIAEKAMYHIDRMYDDFIAENNIEINKDVDLLLDDVQYNIMKIAIKKEIGD
jgi:predicted nucleotidyltransferase